MTNLDNIRQMNSEKLAEFLYDLDCCEHCYYNGKQCINTEGDCDCKNGIKAWLEAEVTPTLTDDEKVILSNIDKKYKWIAKNGFGNLYIEKGKNILFMSCYNHLFNFIRDNDKYEISKLLGE